MDMTPHAPFIRVIKSARCMARTREKCPTSAERRVFCLSMAGLLDDMTSLVLPLEPDTVLLLLDILRGVTTRFGRAEAVQVIEFGEGYRSRK